jgi:hypothetical protein
MTAVVCFNWGMGAVFVADSRLSYDSPSGDIGAVRDVCQKVWVPTGWAALGFAGNLCLGNALAGTFFIALRDKAWTRDNLLTNDDEMRGLALEVVTSHPDRFGDGHVACVEDGAALLFAYVRLVAVNRQDGSFDHFQLGTATVALNSRATCFDVSSERRSLVMGDGLLSTS